MDTNTMIIVAIGLLAGIAGLYYFSYLKDKKGSPDRNKATRMKLIHSTHRQLKLQAYERLVILAERIALPNVISRTNEPGSEKREMQQLLTQAISQEFEYNLSQQIYVSNEAWEAIRNLKDQNIHIINQIASIMPPEAQWR